MRRIEGGIYLVVDPSMNEQILLKKIAEAIQGGVDVIQIWNHWNEDVDKHKLVDAICSLAHKQNIPVLINEDWTLLKDTMLDGVHFDMIPNDINNIREDIGRTIYCGITCGNDLATVEWANEHKLDYISFCSMFPSSSAGVCEIVSIDAVKKAKAITTMPIFLAGGISLDNMKDLKDTQANGIAVISAIMKADDAAQKTKQFKQQLTLLNQ